MLTLIGQILGCLIVAAIIGMAMGWFLRSFTTSEKRQQLSEIAARLRGREHEMDSLHHELKVRTSAVQILESKMVAAEAALKDLQAEAAAKGEQLDLLQTELADKTALSSALAANASGSLISTFVWSMTKLAQSMKNITSCNTRSSNGVKFGSHLSLLPWLMEKLFAVRR